jgi:pimeloyl-ACP methyl ester carboxylesterase
MRFLVDSATTGQKASTMVILLPGATYLPEDFITQGFIQAVRERDLDIDLILPELQFEQIADQSALRALNREVVAPAFSQYETIWLAGISIGGYIAMAHAHYYPGQIHGLFLMAPYPGNRMTTGEIANAGGLHAWQPGVIADDDIERGNWAWLQHTQAVKIYLGYGTEDRFADGIALMEQAIPATQVDKIPGDHTWPVWQQLWLNFLDKKQAQFNTVRDRNTAAKS